MQKSPTGIPGFDDIAFGGLPTGRTTLLTGGPGSGKTVFALQTIVQGAFDRGDPGIFVAFEEDPATLRESADTFDWGVSELSGSLLHFLDARPIPDLSTGGPFDIRGMLAILELKVQEIGAKQIVFDAIDMLLAQMGGPDVMRREVYRLQEWLSKTGLTAIITSKTWISDPLYSGLPSMEFMQFMVACSVVLNNDIVDGISQRNLRIAKYRGTSFHGNAVPFLIGYGGLDVAFTQAPRKVENPIPTERVSTGLLAVDRLLQGGFFRGDCALLTGLPGTGKTTLCGAFLAAACERGERALFVTFVSRAEEIVRNLKSVSINLEPYLANGSLRLVSSRASDGSAETHLLSIRSIAREHGATCLVTDPLSALAKSGNKGTAPGVSERLVDWAKAEGRTLLCTSLLDDAEEPTEATPLQISTIADTWIHLSNDVSRTERNRTLSIIKSRGTGHSNKVHEFMLSDAGLALVENYASGGEILMDSLRWSHHPALELRPEFSGGPADAPGSPHDAEQLPGDDVVRPQGSLAGQSHNTKPHQESSDSSRNAADRDRGNDP